MLGRIIGTLLAAGLYETCVLIATPRLLVASSQVAGGQFDNSDSVVINAIVSINLIGSAGALPGITLLVVLVLIWWGPIKQRLGR